jgi:ABC-type spermidine/putrescine transport system permease subunit I
MKDSKEFKLAARDFYYKKTFTPIKRAVLMVVFCLLLIGPIALALFKRRPFATKTANKQTN